MYGYECYTMTDAQEKALLRFDKRVLYRIYEGVCEQSSWRRTNADLSPMYKNVNVVKFARLQWAGHVMRITRAKSL